MSFLPPSPIFTTRRSVFHWSWLNTRHVRCMSRHRDFLARQTIPITVPPPSFESLGLPTPFIKALQRGYNNVENPKGVQAQLIPAVLGTQDIFLLDVKGSGKSFGLIIGLANKPRLVSKVWKNGKEFEKQHITAIYLVPQRDLAFQLYRVLQRTVSHLRRTRIETMAYVLVRGTGVPIKRQMQLLEERPPHILICTPHGLLDAFKENRDALQLSTVSTIVMDEMNLLIKDTPRNDRQAGEKGEKMTTGVTGLVRQFLDRVYSKRRNGEGTTGKKTPQLILSSATMYGRLNDYLCAGSGWLDKDNLVKIIRDYERQKSGGKKVEKAGRSVVGGKQGRVLPSASEGKKPELHER